MKKIWIILLFSIVFVFALITYGAYLYYAPPQKRQAYHTSSNNDTVCIAYIGDSWAYLHKYHKCCIAKLLEDTLHHPVKVQSYGICGLTSKEIYKNMFDNTEFKHFLQEGGYSYCFVSAGINDTYKKMSTVYYKKSMDEIIQFLLSNKIRPIILEIPNYNIQETYNWQKSYRKTLRDVSMWINSTPINCKQIFRNALDKLIIEKGYQDSIGIIRYKTWNNSYHKDLKDLYLHDGMHLNDKGYAKLDSIIALEIINHYNKNKQ